MRGNAVGVRIAKAICLAGALVVLTQCSSLLTTNPDPRAFSGTGTWIGSIADQQFGAGRMELVLVAPHTDEVFRGSWKATFSDGQIASGTARGAAIGDRQPLTLTCASGGTASLTLVIAGAHATGTYETVNCASLTRGSVDLTKS